MNPAISAITRPKSDDLTTTQSRSALVDLVLLRGSWPTLFLNSPRRAPSLGRRASIPLLCPTAPPEASFLGVGRQRLVRWRWRQSLTQPVHRSSYQREGGQVEGTKNTSAKQGSVCFSKLHAAPLFATGFGQLTISHIKQQAPSLQLRTEC